MANPRGLRSQRFQWPVSGLGRSAGRLLTLRAIESGAAVLRPALQGIERSTDAYGRQLGQADCFANDKYLLLTDRPTRGERTLYARIGDSVAFLCLAELALLTAPAFLRRSHPGRALQLA